MAVFLGGAILGRAARKPVVHLSDARGGFEKHKPLIEAILRWVIPASPKLVPLSVSRSLKEDLNSEFYLQLRSSGSNGVGQKTRAIVQNTLQPGIVLVGD